MDWLQIKIKEVFVEYCNSVKSIKYISKYVNNKYVSSDQAVFGIQKDGQTINEINREGRYIRSNEAAWRMLSQELFNLAINARGGGESSMPFVLI